MGAIFDFQRKRPVCCTAARDLYAGAFGFTSMGCMLDVNSMQFTHMDGCVPHKQVHMLCASACAEVAMKACVIDT
eukprot:scaffold240305_cov19-Tisochrysis_lutea.AAC.1